MRAISPGPVFVVPTSKLASWSTRLGWFAFVVVMLSIAIVRTGFLEIEPALATFGAALVLAALAILLAFASFVAIWRQGFAGIGRAVLGLLLGLLLLAYPGYFAYRASKLPMINDISTDTTNPPRFAVLARLRPPGTSDYPGARVAALQAKAYPDIDGLEYEAPVQLVYRIVLQVVTKRKWHIVDAIAPTAQRPGEIEAVATTLIMGFRDDVAVRVSNAAGSARIDVRSASRYGSTDFGTNAKRIASLLGDIDDAMNEALTAPTRQEPKEEEKPPPKKRPAPKRKR